MKKPTIRLLEEKKKEKRQKIDKQPFLRGAGDFEIPEMRALGDIENLATETTEDGIVLTWENVNTNEDGFLVERSLDGVNFAGIDFIESGSTTYTDLASNLDENVEYYYYRIIGIKGHNRTMPSKVQQGAGLILCQEYKTVLDAMATEPTMFDKIKQNRWVKSMVDNGLYSKAEILDLFSADTPENSLINWKNPSQHKPTRSGNPEFRKYEGFRGSNISAIELNYTPSINADLTGKDDICVIIGVGNDYPSNAPVFGGVGSDSSALTIIPYHTNGNLYARCNSDINSYYSAPISNSIKYFTINRNSASSFDFYLNKTKITSNVASKTIVNSELGAIGYFNQNVIAKNNFSSLRFVFIFKSLLQSEINNVIDFTEEYLLNYHTNIINYSNYISSADKSTKVTIPLTTYDGSGQTAHPSVIDCGNNWNGYRYWMANTPYPSSNSNYENPSIWASSDGVNFIIPDGLINPIINKPSGGFNADTELYFENEIMYLVFKETISSPFSSCIKMTKSTDGINWTAPVIILCPQSDETECISPSLVKIGSRYYIYYYKYLTSVTNSPKLRRASCDAIDGTYSNIEDLNVKEINNYIWWHLGAKVIDDKVFIAAVLTDNSSPGHEIYLMKSSDGINFEYSPYPTIYTTGLGYGYYRPTISTIGSQNVIYYGKNTSGVWSCEKININIFV